MKEKLEQAIKPIELCPCIVFYNDENLGVIHTQEQLNSLRLTIKHYQIEGVYLIHTDKNNNTSRIDIDKYGSPAFWPQDFFDTIEKQLMQLCGYTIYNPAD
jgi:tRNA G26 N,N-dimethylase Trm1